MAGRLLADILTGLVLALSMLLQDAACAQPVSFAGKQVKIAVKVAGFGDAHPVSFVREVQPTLSKLGCNAGTCHGSANGKNGFKLSLRGYDPLFDHMAFTDDYAARRIDGCTVYRRLSWFRRRRCEWEAH